MSTQITMDEVRKELGRSNQISLNDTDVRTLGEKPSGQIAMSDLIGKKSKPAYYLQGYAVTQQYGSTYDAGTVTNTWNNISRAKRLRSRVWATTVGSHRNDGAAGFVRIQWTIKSQAGSVLYDVVKINQYTSGDGAGGIHQWSSAAYIQDLVGASSENVSVTITQRFIAGDYQGHIGGGQARVRRILGIEAEVGY